MKKTPTLAAQLNDAHKQALADLPDTLRGKWHREEMHIGQAVLSCIQSNEAVNRENITRHLQNLQDSSSEKTNKAISNALQKLAKNVGGAFE